MVDARRETPTNTNLLSDRQFKFMVKKLPTVNFNVQNVNIPGIHSPPWKSPNPLVDYPIHGDHIQFDDIMVNFLVDEDMVNYMEIWDWIRAYGYPNNWQEYSELTNPALEPGEGLRSDISLVIMNSSRLPNLNIVFRDAFPTSLSSIILDTTQDTENFVEAAATFSYTSYNIERLRS